MWTLLIAFAIAGVNPHVENALVAAPFDLALGQQTIALRKPLINRMSGARLILFTRDSSNGTSSTDSLADFQDNHPLGTVDAIATTKNSNEMRLIHTGYSYYKGAKGIVLTLEDSAANTDLFISLNINSGIKMSNVKAVWIDRGSLDVRDLVPSL